MRLRWVASILVLGLLTGQSCEPQSAVPSDTTGDTSGTDTSTGGDTSGTDNTDGNTDTGSNSGNVDSKARDVGPQLIQTEHVRSVGSPKVTVIEYADFQCPFCGLFARETLPTIENKYVKTGKVKWIFRHFPLTRIHQFAQQSSEAAECANNQGSFWIYHDLLFQKKGDLSTDQLKSYATQLGINRTLFDPCVEGGGQASRVQSDFDQGVKDGVTSTPTFFVNGQKVTGNQSVDEMSAILDAAIAAAP